MNSASFSSGNSNSGYQIGINNGTVVFPPDSRSGSAGRESSAESVNLFNVPFDLTDVPLIENFVGRQDEMDKLWKYFSPEGSQSRKVAISHGLGGMGKTQLAVRFARDQRTDFSAIFWLAGKDRATLLQSMSSVLPRLPGQTQKTEAINHEELEQRAEAVMKWLAQENNSRWLIIFDNIDHYSSCDSEVDDAYDIGKYFPKADHGSILITSRVSTVVELGKAFPIHKLDPSNSIELLLKNSGISDDHTMRSLKDSPETISLAKRLDGLPLAIVIAASFMRQTGTSIAEYLEYYEESWSDLQSQSTSHGRQYPQGNMLQTWMMSYRDIQNRHPGAADLLLLLAHFDNRDIWYELIEQASKGCQCDLPEWLGKATSSGLAFKVSVKPLIEFSLLETKQLKGSYAMHPVVQDWCIQIASRNANSLRLSELAIIAVGYSVPNKYDANSADLQRRISPHANFVCNRPFSDNDIRIWGGFLGIGNLYSDQGKPEEAQNMFQKALDGHEKNLHSNHVIVLNTVHSLGIVYTQQGKLQDAERMYQRALSGKETVLGPDHTSTLFTVNSLGLLYFDQGKLEEAEEMYQRALTGKEKAIGPDHTSTLDTVNNLANLYFHQEKLQEAEEMYQRALAGKKRAVGPDHISTLDTANNLTNLLFKQGKLQEAEEMYRRALTGKERAVGPGHISFLSTINNLANLLFQQGKLQEAEEMYQRALAGYGKALGTDHETHLPTLITFYNLGFSYAEQKKLQPAEEMYQRALAGCMKVLGPDNSMTQDVQEQLDLLKVEISNSKSQTEPSS